MINSKSLRIYKKSIIIDLDGTLVPHIKVKENNGRKDWDALLKSTLKVSPNKWCMDLVFAMLMYGYTPIYLTSRPERFRAITVQWLDKYMGVHGYQLFMRPDSSYEKCYEFKLKPLPPEGGRFRGLASNEV